MVDERAHHLVEESAHPYECIHQQASSSCHRPVVFHSVSPGSRPGCPFRKTRSDCCSERLDPSPKKPQPPMVEWRMQLLLRNNRRCQGGPCVNISNCRNPGIIFNTTCGSPLRLSESCVGCDRSKCSVFTPHHNYPCPAKSNATKSFHRCVNSHCCHLSTNNKSLPSLLSINRNNNPQKEFPSPSKVEEDKMCDRTTAEDSATESTAAPRDDQATPTPLDNSSSRAAAYHPDIGCCSSLHRYNYHLYHHHHHHHSPSTPGVLQTGTPNSSRSGSRRSHIKLNSAEAIDPRFTPMCPCGGRLVRPPTADIVCGSLSSGSQREDEKGAASLSPRSKKSGKGRIRRLVQMTPLASFFRPRKVRWQYFSSFICLYFTD